jgi:hypothetical protein
MKRVFTAFTTEADDATAALDEVLSQIDTTCLLSSTIGFVTYTPDFSASGILEALQEALPFDLLGMTTLGTTTDSSDDLVQLSVMVLSSDEMLFSTALSEPVINDDARVVKDCYRQAAEALPEEPRLIIAYAPLILQTVGGDFFTEALTEAGGGVPLFGSLALDPEISTAHMRVFYRGHEYGDRVALTLVGGDVHPRFVLATMSRLELTNVEGLVTASHNNTILDIDNKPAAEFIRNSGVQVNDDNSVDGIIAYPIFVDYNDESIPVMRSMLTVTPEGSIIAGGDVHVGSHVSIGFLDDREIVNSARVKVPELQPSAEDAILFFSCATRYFTLGYDNQEETRTVHRCLEATGTKFVLAYSGGEFCPVPNKNDDGTLTNRFHNNTLIGLAI